MSKKELKDMSTSDKIDRLRDIWDSMYRTSLKQAESVDKLEYLIAPLTIEDLIERLAAGWELVPPTPPKHNTMEELAKAIDEDHKKNKEM